MPRLTLRVASVLLFLLSTPALAASLDNDRPSPRAPYQLGQGLEFPQLGLKIGGYLNLQYSDLQGRPGNFDARDVSLFFSQDLPHRWQLFSEVQFGDALTLSEGNTTTEGSEFDLERLYADYHATRTATFRLGKFLTPIGRWNLIHAAPLEWTTSRPVTTSAPFARHATGAMMYGSFAVRESDFDYTLFVDDSSDLDPRRQNERAFEDEKENVTQPVVHNAFNRAAGAHIAYHFPNDTASIGISYARMELRDPSEKKALLGADAIWSVNRMEFSGEWLYRNSLGPVEGGEHGGYVQAVLPLSEHVYLVGRHERYKAAIYPNTAGINTAGITYRPFPAVAVKIEYRDGTHNAVIAPSGWLGSLAILF